MRRWHSVLLLSILAVLAGAAVRYAWSKHEQKKQEAAYRREVGYQLALHSYTGVLTVGMTRKEVEGYLQTKGVRFSKLCCVDEKSAYADITKIGQESAPWYCSEQNIYIAFQFASEAGGSVSADPSDTLRKITIFPRLEGCL
jgi:hypothetical protein